MATMLRDAAFTMVAGMLLAAIGVGAALALAYRGGVAMVPMPMPTPATVTATPEPARSVPCPAEDSCSLDYRDGAWHVGPEGSGHEVTPVPWQSDGAWHVWYGGRLLVWDPLTLTWVPVVADG